jgi:antitoxin component YwqK of YwqJK toxin-antitoxin module
LIEAGNYVHGMQSGSDIIYNRSGTIAYKADFAGDKQNGYSYHFDTSGNLVQKSNNYFGLNVGGSVNYKSDSVKEFYFYDLDENLLMYIDYDSIKAEKKISEQEYAYLENLMKRFDPMMFK